MIEEWWHLDNYLKESKMDKIYLTVFGQALYSNVIFVDKLRVHLNFREVTSLERSDIVIAFAPITSRAGTDLEAALKRIPQSSRPVVLVVLHYTFDLNFVAPESRYFVNSNVNRSDVFTVDCLFNEDQGLLECQRNNEAVQAVTAHLISKGVLRKLADVYYPAGPANFQISPVNKVILSVGFEAMLGGIICMIIGYCGPIPGLFIGILGGLFSGYFHHFRSKRPKPSDRPSEPLLQDRTHNPQM
ncbi:hypothetical protein AMEX_G26225 [Astyanax mexicanus]|uniref:Uncharacterized protein n=1 Tax=Astyanax mexicanus TaxID=7994 RepID=A0A8T2KU66_ASTMX|nr:hypothetical protein AMEX_G26225 [Astyanax mexicanus]